MTLLQALHLMAFALSPAAPHTFHAGEVMSEIASVVGSSQRTPVFATKEQDAAAMLVIAWNESSFKKDAVGDHGTALCAYQLHFAPRAVLNNLHLCTSIAYERMRWSFSVCRAAPFAQYVGGCYRPKARRMSLFRLKETVRVLRAVLGRAVEI
jgi:hypothetical protein